MKYVSRMWVILLLSLIVACQHNDDTELNIENSRWLKIEGLNTAVNFNDITFVGKHGWIVGENGLYLSSQDSGATWKIRQNGSTSLLAVDFVDNNLGWMINNRSQLDKTEDSGLTWKHSLLPQDINKIDFINTTEGWAIGYSGTILRTRNGGSSWSIQAAPTGYDFFVGLDIHFISNNKGWIAPWGTSGENSGGVLFTEDGGETWQKQATDNVYYATGIDFINDSEGWVAMYDLTGNITCPKESNSFITSIYHTVNSGKDWQRISTLCGYSGDIDFVNQRYGWVLTKQPEQPTHINVTEDGGITWATHYKSETSLSRLQMRNPAEGWAIGDQGTVLHFSEH